MGADTLILALAQCNLHVGDIAGNVEKIRQWRAQAAAEGVELIIFPELAVCGYPPEDLLFKHAFRNESIKAIRKLAKETKDGGPAMIVGGLWLDEGKLYNAAFLLDDGRIVDVLTKRNLPNYGVFDEKRQFEKGDRPKPTSWRGMKLGILVCEDLWDDRWPGYVARKGIDMLISVNASPYEMGKAKKRMNVAELAGREAKAPVVYANLVGGQDELVFDGRSFVLDLKGEVAAHANAFEEEMIITQWKIERERWNCVKGPKSRKQNDEETIYQALVLGLRDYVEKNKFPGVVVGLSGGIDSGLTAAIAVDALGPKRVHALMMPYDFTSKASVEDAQKVAKKLGIELHNVPIEPGMKACKNMLKELFKGTKRDTTEENLQARLRGMLLMAASNKFGWMVVTTGNKSEMSVGYATLYGDMCGGYSVLKDVYKTTVFRLAKWRNSYPKNNRAKLRNLLGPEGSVIPNRMITRPPTAELAPNQKDEDSLPPYPVLDAILQGMIERRESIEELVDQGFDREVVAKISRMLHGAEYKRRQAPPGVKVSGMAFGRDRRYPIVNGYM